jgi:ribosome-associated translation inhibitor RaiA
MRQQTASSFSEEILQQFQQVNQTINPALELTWQLRFSELQNQLKIEDLLNLQPQISQAITQGEDTFAQIEEILKKLTQAPAVASRQSMFI